MRNFMQKIFIVGAKSFFVAKDEESVLAAMERHGRNCIPSGCRGGGCGVCKVRIVSGEYRLKKMSKEHISEKEEQEGFALACRCIALSNITLSVVSQKAINKQ
jgi:ferredoxin